VCFDCKASDSRKPQEGRSPSLDPVYRPPLPLEAGPMLVPRAACVSHSWLSYVNPVLPKAACSTCGQSSEKQNTTISRWESAYLWCLTRRFDRQAAAPLCLETFHPGSQWEAVVNGIVYAGVAVAVQGRLGNGGGARRIGGQPSSRVQGLDFVTRRAELRVAIRGNTTTTRWCRAIALL